MIVKRIITKRVVRVVVESVVVVILNIVVDANRNADTAFAVAAAVTTVINIIFTARTEQIRILKKLIMNLLMQNKIIKKKYQNIAIFLTKKTKKNI